MPTKKEERYSEIYNVKDGKPGEHLVMKIDRAKRVSKYYLQGNSAKHINTITFEDTIGFPVGLRLNRNGYGFKDSYYFLEVLRSQFPPDCPIELVVTNGDKPQITGTKNIKIKIPLTELQELLGGTWQITAEANTDKRKISGSFLTSLFPDRICISEDDFGAFESGAVADTLSKKGVLEKMNDKDLEALINIFPKIFDPKTKFRAGVNKVREYKLRIASDSKKLSEKIYLEEVIKEFAKKNCPDYNC